ncbi:MAG: hypothetical protein M3Z33_08175, partial [Actinomycetota bacterium]|nr:hypothetical protein [Actinomycetota bacterium]
MAAKYGARIAFVGVNVEDHDDQASAFRRRFPVTYPSYVEPDQSTARAIQASGARPGRYRSSRARPGTTDM